MTMQASDSLGLLRMIPLQLVVVAVAVEIPMAQMLKYHLSFVKVFVAVVARADGLIPLPCFGCC